jgi:O-antigen ligase
MKKFLLAALAISILIPVFAQMREFYYLSVLFASALLFFAFKKKPLTLIDLLALFLITIPFHTFRFGGKEQFIRLSEIAFFPLATWWLIVRFLNRAKEPLKMRKEFILLGIYLLINIISVKNSLYPFISFKRVVILAYLFLFTFLVTDILNDGKKITTLIRASIFISAISAILAVLQSIFPQLLFFDRVPVGKFAGISFYRAGVGWHDPNYYALYLGMNATLTLPFLLSAQEGGNRFFKWCFMLQVLGILATFSRTIYISLIIIALFLLFAYQKKRLAVTLSVIVIMVAGIVATSSFLIYRKYPFVASVVYRVPEKSQLKEQPYLIMGHRRAAFIANWNMFLDHPILGVGPFMASYNFARYQPRRFAAVSPQWLASHNQYLQLLSEKGIFGFLLYLGFIFLILKKIRKHLKSPLAPGYKNLLFGLQAAIFVYLIASLALESSYELQFWLTMGLSLALFSIIEREHPPHAD